LKRRRSLEEAKTLKETFLAAVTWGTVAALSIPGGIG
jgi:hypothetical protein